MCDRWKNDSAVVAKNNWVSGKNVATKRNFEHHEESSTHQTALTLSHNASQSRTVSAHFTEQQRREVPLLHTLVRTSYFITHQQLPTSIYPSLLDLLSQEQVHVSSMYRSRQACG
jgi:hypothetical protein